MKYWLLCAGVAALVPVLDQLTKYFVRTFLQVGESVSVWGDFFRIHYILNDGMAFGRFPVYGLRRRLLQHDRPDLLHPSGPHKQGPV